MKDKGTAVGHYWISLPGELKKKLLARRQIFAFLHICHGELNTWGWTKFIISLGCEKREFKLVTTWLFSLQEQRIQ